MAATLLFSGGAAAQTPAPKHDQTKASPNTVTAPPLDAEIAGARTNGMVRVNTSTKIYHTGE